MSKIVFKYYCLGLEDIKKVALEVYNDSDGAGDTLAEYLVEDFDTEDVSFGSLSFYKFPETLLERFLEVDNKYFRLAILLEVMVNTYPSKRKNFFISDIKRLLGVTLKVKDLKCLNEVYTDLGMSSRKELLCIKISTRKDTQSLLSYFSNTAVVEESKKEVEVPTDTAVTTITDIQERAKVDSDFADFLDDIKPTNVKLKADSYSTDFSDFEF